jgi:hypothetical protein
MKKSDPILFLIALTVGVFAIFASCDGKSKPDPDIHYINIDCIIVEKISSVGSGRLTSKAFLIRGTKDTTLYSEYVDLYRYDMSDSLYYSSKVGDTLHFDYIRKNRFFKK